jgi:DNA-binding CsgD family transcriptional regulator
LTRRESEALEWTLRGKTAWEVAQILGISERTAIKFLQNAMKKFDVRSKHQAALAALQLGLIGHSVSATFSVRVGSVQSGQAAGGARSNATL